MKQGESWNSKIGFIIAAAGAAMGLGAIWKFPYMIGTDGGTFLFTYLFFVFLIGWVIMIAEMIMGRYTGKSVVGAFASFHRNWSLMGYIIIIGGVLMLAFYSVVGGWSIAYMINSLVNFLKSLGGSEVEVLDFSSLIQSPLQSISYLFLFLILNVLILIKGVRSGIERLSKVLMPMLFLMLLLLLVRIYTFGLGLDGLKFLFQFNQSNFDAKLVLDALGFAFFSLALGLGTMLTYASYLPKDARIVPLSFSVVITQVFGAMLAALVIVPAAFMFKFDLTAGPTLTFDVLPAIFAQFPAGGMFFSFVFFLLLFFAALTSSISVLEPGVSWLKERQWTRPKATWTLGSVIFLLGIPCALSFGMMGSFHVFGKTVFDLFDFIVSNMIIPLAVLSYALILGWTHKDAFKEAMQVEHLSSLKMLVLVFLLKWVVPLMIIVIAVSQWI